MKEKKEKKDYSRMPNTFNLANLIEISDEIFAFIFGGFSNPLSPILRKERGNIKYTFIDFIKSLLAALIVLVIFYFWFRLTNK